MVRLLQENVARFKKLDRAEQLARSLAGKIPSRSLEAYQNALQLEQELRYWEDTYPPLSSLVLEAAWLVRETGWMWVSNKDA